MQENKFEKQVQEKMEELRMAPSEKVWTNIENEIKSPKKRRGLLLWLFFFLGLLLLGGGYFIFLPNSSFKKSATDLVQENKETREKAPIVPPKKSTAKVPGKNNANRTELPVISNQKSDQENTLQEGRKTGRKILKKEPALFRLKTKGIIKEESESPEQYTMADRNNQVEQEENANNESKKEPPKPNHEQEDSVQSKNASAVVKNNPPIKDTSSEKKISKINKQENKSSKWKFGFTAGAGVSEINRTLFKRSLAGNSYNYSSAVSGPANPPNHPSTINSGFSFYAGGVVNRQLSNRISLSAGINYHYSSSVIHTGNFVDSSLNLSQAPGPYNSSSVNRYFLYGNNNTYINRYHFIEIPVSMNLQANRSRKVPLLWSAGISVSYMISSNALYYDSGSNVYFEAKRLFNKTQLNTATGLMIGLPLGGNSLQIGPELQYGITRLLSKSTGTPEHLFYSGIKVIYIPGKK
jgi:hypothetical protein